MSDSIHNLLFERSKLISDLRNNTKLIFGPDYDIEVYNRKISQQFLSDHYVLPSWESIKTNQKIDSEVLPLCDILNDIGYRTSQSCCGHKKKFPWVSLIGEITDTKFIMLYEYLDACSLGKGYQILMEKNLSNGTGSYGIPDLYNHFWRLTIPFDYKIRPIKPIINDIITSLLEFK